MKDFLNSETELYAVIGDPISHSLSPDIHNKIFRELGEDKAYLALRVPPSELKEAVSVLRNNFMGFNVTIPHKEAIIQYLDEIDDAAKTYGAVNTVRVEDGRLKGYNTDGYGFIKGMELAGIDIEGKKALMLGSGGAARVIALELLNKGCQLTIANRSIEKATKLKEELLINSKNKSIEIASPFKLEADYYCIVNTTPVGMAPLDKELPIDDTKLLKGAGLVYDLIYNPYKTLLLEEADAAGCFIINGFSMLYHQAIRAQELWRKGALADDLIDSIFQQMEERIGRITQSNE